MKQQFYPASKMPSCVNGFLFPKKKISILLLCFFLTFYTNTDAQITAVQSGPWNDPATWDSSVPGSSDDVIIGADIEVTVSSTGALCNSIQIGYGDYLNNGSLIFSGTSSLWISDGIVLGDAAGATGTITMDVNATLTCGYIVEGDPDISGIYNTNYGTIVFTGAPNLLPDNLYQFNNLVIDNGVTTLVNSTLQIDGNLTINAGATLDAGTVGANRNSVGGALTIANGGTLRIGGSGTLPYNFITHAIGASSTIEYYGTSQTVSILNSGQAYGNLVIAGSGIMQLNGSTGIAGDLTVSSGIFSLNSYSANRTAAGGILTVANGATLRIGGSGTLPSNFFSHAIGASSTVEYRGTSSQNVAPLNWGQKYGNLVITNSVKTLTGNVTVSGTIVFGGAPDKLIIASNTLTLEGAIAGSLAASRNFSCSANSNLILNGSFNRTVYFDATTPGTTNAIKNLTINHNNYVTTMGNDLVVSGTLTFTDGKLAVNDKTLTLKGNVVNTVINGLRGSIASNLIVNSTASPTLYFDQATNGTTNAINNFTANSTGQTTTLGSAVRINGNLTVSAGTLDLAAFDGNRASVGGTLSIASSATLKIGGTNTFPANYTAHSVVSGSTVNYAGTNQTVAVLHSSQDYSNLIISGSGTKSLAGTISVFGNLAFAGGKISIGNYILIISGSVTNTITGGIAGSSNSTVIFNSVSSNATLSFDQTTPGATNKLRDLIFDCSSKTLSLGNALLVAGTVYPLTGTMSSAGNLTLLSSAAKTASVSAGANAGGYITGDVTVERYISSGRKWQLLSVATNGAQTISEAWQESQACGSSVSNGYGTWITTSDPAAISLGFDYQSNDNSMKTYAPSTNTWVTVPTTSAPIVSNNGYFLFVRGDRGCTSVNTNVSSVVLRTKGPLNQGDQPAFSVSAGKLGCISNAYPSAIDFRLLNKTGGIDNVFYVWDPKLSGSLGFGAYQTFTLSGGNYTITPGGGSYGSGGSVYNTIQSGQAFFAHATGSSGTVQIIESAKSSGSMLVARPSARLVKQLRMNLTVSANNKAEIIDGVMVDFSDLNSDSIDGQDAIKLDNLAETFAIVRNGQKLSVEKRADIIDADTIFLNAGKLKTKTYQLQLIPFGLTSPFLTAYIGDKFTGMASKLNLADSNTLSFTVTGNPASKAADRFRIIFKKARILPVEFSSAEAAQKNNGIEVQWKMQNEINTASYEIEKSSDGMVFHAAGIKMPGIANAPYTWLDDHIQNGDNYYRIKYISTDGSFKYSQAVKLIIDLVPSISVYPNPVEGKQLNLHFTNMDKGIYSLTLTASNGQEILSKLLRYNVENSRYKISLPETTAKGNYQLSVKAAGGKQHNIKILVQ